MKQPKFLVIDDDPASLALVKAALSQGKYENIDAFLHSPEGQAAYLETDYDVLITDLRMPVLSGFDIISEFKSRGKSNISIIVLTAQAEADSAQRALEMGADKVFFKPYKVAELLQEVERLLAV
ncbi:MAG: response regulator [Bermanella sp.]